MGKANKQFLKDLRRDMQRRRLQQQHLTKQVVSTPGSSTHGDWNYDTAIRYADGAPPLLPKSHSIRLHPESEVMRERFDRFLGTVRIDGTPDRPYGMYIVHGLDAEGKVNPHVELWHWKAVEIILRRSKVVAAYLLSMQLNNWAAKFMSGLDLVVEGAIRDDLSGHCEIIRQLNVLRYISYWCMVDYSVNTLGWIHAIDPQEFQQIFHHQEDTGSDDTDDTDDTDQADSPVTGTGVATDIPSIAISQITTARTRAGGLGATTKSSLSLRLSRKLAAMKRAGKIHYQPADTDRPLTEAEQEQRNPSYVRDNYTGE